jgi:two-component system osmolarity sensor histidine kinase EnvZ
MGLSWPKLPFQFTLKSLKPHGLMTRFLLIFFTPLVLVQLVAAFVFVDRHLDSVTKLLAQNIVGASRSLINLYEKKIFTEDELNRISTNHYHFAYKFYPDRSLTEEKSASGWITGYLKRELELSIKYKYQVFSKKSLLFLLIQLPDGVMQLDFPRKLLFSNTAELVLYWALGTTIFSILIAGLFLRNQIRPLILLERKTKQFGRGETIDDVPVHGAKEIRNLIESFNIMKNRIKRQVMQRTQVLAGISHDLRTPLTRLKLELSMAPKSDLTQSLNHDVEEMQSMVSAYLDFAKGDHRESFEEIHLRPFLERLIKKFKNVDIDFKYSDILPDVVFNGRPESLERAFENLFNNASRHASTVSIYHEESRDHVHIILDDDGKGIPKDKRQEVFQAFYRLDASRNTETGGVGLGLSIVQDIIHSHGGRIDLDEAPGGGLRIQIKLPK